MYYNPKTNAFEYFNAVNYKNPQNPNAANYKTYQNPNEVGDTNAPENAFENKAIRSEFIRKVYAVLLFQLVCTAVFLCLFIFEPNTKSFAAKHNEMLWISMTLFMGIYIVFACIPNIRRSFPLNIICLIIFTLSASILLGAISSQYKTNAVLLSVGISAAVCLGMTLFSLQTKIDFRLWAAVTLICTMIVLCFGIVYMFIPYNQIVTVVYASLGAVIFSLFLVLDTLRMTGKDPEYSLTPEEYVYAAFNMYFDIFYVTTFVLLGVGIGSGANPSANS